MCFALALLLLSLAAGDTVVSQEGKQGSCLLAVGRSSLRTQAQTLMQRSVQYRAWNDEHKLLENDVSSSMGVLDNFIASQDSSGDACFARLLESKRALDDLLKDLKGLSSQVSSHEQVLETEAENLNVTLMTMESVEDVFDTSIAKCDKLQAEARDDLAQYRSELKELDQISKPKVRHIHALKIPANTSLPKTQVAPTTDGDSPSSLPPSALIQSQQAQAVHDHVQPQAEVWDREACTAFVNFLQQRKRESPIVDASLGKPRPVAPSLGKTSSDLKPIEVIKMEVSPPKKADCDKERVELQDAFTEAYEEIQDLIKDASERSVDEMCYKQARAVRTAEMVPLIAQREEATTKIEYSSQAVSSLDPVIDLVHDRIDAMDEHIQDTLTPECDEAGKVTDALSKVRELIFSLDECPGRGDFKLKIPKRQTSDFKSAAPSPSSSTTSCKCRTTIVNGLRNKLCTENGATVDSCGPTFKHSKKR